MTETVWIALIGSITSLVIAVAGYVYNSRQVARQFREQANLESIRHREARIAALREVQTAIMQRRCEQVERILDGYTNDYFSLLDECEYFLAITDIDKLKARGQARIDRFSREEAKDLSKIAVVHS